MSSADNQRFASHGRGGAGNIGRDDPNAHTQASDLVTPTLKSERYTTGRGGSGNMASNDPHHPEIARASQDVDAPPGHRDPEGPHHFGRGGAANVAKSSPDEAQAARNNNQRKSEEARRSSFGAEAKGLVDKGKDLLNKLGKK